MGSHHNQRFEFSIADSEENFNILLRQKPDSWIYRTKKVEYVYNSYGHRNNIEPEDISSEYLLFTGCSLTEGTGLAYEDRYSTVVANELNLQHYNLAIEGSGPDAVSHNLLSFISLVPHKPTAVIIQWPDFSRFFNISNGTIKYFNTGSADSDDPYECDIWNSSVKLDLTFSKNNFIRLWTLDFLSKLGVSTVCEIFHGWCRRELVQLHEVESSPHRLNKSYTPYLDRARDNSHPGIKSNQEQAKDLIDLISQIT